MSYMPVFSHLFGLTPAQQWEMDYHDWERYADWADAWLAARGGDQEV